MAAGWLLVAGCWWLVAGGWWLLAGSNLGSFSTNYSANYCLLSRSPAPLICEHCIYLLILLFIGSFFLPSNPSSFPPVPPPILSRSLPPPHLLPIEFFLGHNGYFLRPVVGRRCQSILFLTRCYQHLLDSLIYWFLLLPSPSFWDIAIVIVIN